MRRETFQKLALLLFGLLLGLVLLEAGLRSAGFIVLQLQEHGNRQVLEERSEYVILCLGESTTAIGGEDSYPKQLEKILNERNPGKKVAVVNKGIIGTNTTAIIAQLPEYLAEYNPDMVITMMGINEGPGAAGTGGVALHSSEGFFKNLRVFKLFRLLWDRTAYNIESARASRRINREAEDILALAGRALTATGLNKRPTPSNLPEEAAVHIAAAEQRLEKDDFQGAIPLVQAALEAAPGDTAIITRLASCLREVGRFQEDREMLRRLLLIDPVNPDVYVELGNSFRDQGEAEAAEKFYRKALELNPGLSRPYLEWGHLHRRRGNVKRALPLFLKAIELEPDNLSISAQLVQLARYCHSLGDFDEAEQLFIQALASEPAYADGYAEMGRFLIWRDRHREAEQMCRKAIEINPEHELAWAELGNICKSLGRKDEAKRMFQKVLDINPVNNIAFRILIVWHLEEKNYEKVEELCREILEIDPRHDVALGIMAVCCQARGEQDLAEKYFSQAGELRAGLLNPKWAENYRKAARMTREKGIPLVAVQYPMRDVDHLKRIFPDPEGIIFVDNREIFRQALEAGSYPDLFTDCFGGDFGHCTPRGNRLLAENIAEAILPVIRGEQGTTGDGD